MPTITGDWGKCSVNNKNRRTRCCLYVNLSGIEFLIDTSPDLFHQILKNRIKKIDKVFYTHIHSDQTNGITDLETFYLNQKKTIDIKHQYYCIYQNKYRSHQQNNITYTCL